MFSTCAGETRDESNGEGSPSPCVRESRQHTVSNVGHNDGLRTDGVVDETTRSSIGVSGWIRSLLVCNDRMWTMGRDVAWSAFASTHPPPCGSVLVNYPGTLSVPRLVTRHSYTFTCQSLLVSLLFSLVDLVVHDWS